MSSRLSGQRRSKPPSSLTPLGVLPFFLAVFLVLAPELLPAQTGDETSAPQNAEAESAGSAVDEALSEVEQATAEADPLEPRQRELADAANAFFADIDALALEAEAMVADPTSSEAELQQMRDQLASARNSIFDLQGSRQGVVTELQTRLDALGPPPAEGGSEPAELAQRRAVLSAQVESAQVPIVKGQEAFQRISSLIAEVDRSLIARFSAELQRHGASPLLPKTWTAAIEEVTTSALNLVSTINAAVSDPEISNRIIRRLPVNLLLVIVGVGLTFSLRRRIDRWTERQLRSADSNLHVALLTGLRSITRLFVPLVGTGLFFAAVQPDSLIGEGVTRNYFVLPAFALAVIGAGWIGDSFFMPRSGRSREVPLDDSQARTGARLTNTVGLIIAATMIVSGLATAWDLSDEAQAALYFPLIVMAGLTLWRSAAVVEQLRLRLMEAGKDADAGGGLGDKFLRVLKLLLLIIAVAGPALAAAGYLVAALYLVVPMMMTLGLIAGSFVVFDLLNRMVKSLKVVRGSPLIEAGNGGLIPVFIAVAVFFFALPLLGLIWGARPSEIADLYRTLANGFTLGGVNISLEVVVRFGLMFAFILALARLIQVLLRVYVLPRTTIDVGAKNAVLAGIGYGGFVFALLSAVSAAGLDLSSLAIVAGALSVGIGFGLQTIVSNFVSGIILLIERPIQEGDWIEVGEFSGYVRGVNVRSTQIETFDRASVIVPNQDLIAGAVLNRTYAGMSGRLIVPVGVAYDSDPREVERILMEVAEGNPLVLEDPAPAVLLIGFGSDCINFEIRCRLRDVNFMMTVRSDMYFEILDRFREAKISIPFPQRDISIKNFDTFGERLGGLVSGGGSARSGET